MKVIAKETLRFLIVQGGTIVLATIFACYGIAVSYGHVPVWLPMISDCGVYPPEKYLFRLGLVVGSVFLHVESILLYNANKAYSNSRLAMILSLLSSLGMGVVAVVSEKENGAIHGTAAVVTFGFYDLYMIVMSYYSSSEPTIGPISMAIKRLCTVLGVGAMVGLVILSGIGADKSYVALCEWIGTLCIMTYNISFGIDVDGLYLCEVCEDTSNTNDEKKKKITV
ncbi:DNA damage-regulated autophagy modulator protein 1-like [Dysidea avara]|uniref:DNA damage-regulated autophagy modulator protein 1-like n=1 Tax=Dysidea avara TaxID=196820 RepID=UPI00331ECA89